MFSSDCFYHLGLTMRLASNPHSLYAGPMSDN